MERIALLKFIPGKHALHTIFAPKHTHKAKGAKIQKKGCRYIHLKWLIFILDRNVAYKNTVYVILILMHTAYTLSFAITYSPNECPSNMLYILWLYVYVSELTPYTINIILAFRRQRFVFHCIKFNTHIMVLLGAFLVYFYYY